MYVFLEKIKIVFLKVKNEVIIIISVILMY